ncbi:MAG: hypothetical protein DRH97_03380 [Chloroflexi bacterium]|nr:MAG: hypothetical protein DRH97_03380 [Chloroflexota bacterium]
MIHSLWFRLLIAFALVIAVTIGTVYLFVSRSIGAEIERYEEIRERFHIVETQAMLSAHYMTRGSWEGVQYVVGNRSVVSGTRIILTHFDRVVIADSKEELVVGETYQPEPPDSPFGSPFPVFSEDWEEVMVRLYIGPEPSAGEEATSPQTLGEAINRFLLWGGLLAAAIALVLTFVLSRRMSSPIGALAATARRLGRGDLSQRVQLRDRGEVRELAQAFNSMAVDLERLEQLRRNLVADVAHELRTPLSNIQGDVEAIRDGVMKPDGATLDSLNEEAALLSRLVDELQDLSLAEAG